MFTFLLKSSSIVFIFNTIGILFNLLITIFISRKIGSVALGIFTLYISNIRFLSIFYKMGLDISLIRVLGDLFKKNISNNKISLIYNNSLKFILFFSLVLVLFILPFKSNIAILYFKDIIFENYILIMSLTAIFLSVVFVNSSIFKATKLFKEFSFYQFTMINLISLISLIFVNIFFQNSLNIDIILIIYTSSIILTSILSTIHIFNKFKFNLNASSIKNVVNSKLIKISIPIFLSNSLNTLVPLIDIFLIGIFHDPQQVAYYNVSYRIASITILFLSSVNHVIMPSLAEFNVDRNKRLLTINLLKSSFISAIISIPIFIFIYFFDSSILGFFGVDFINAKSILIILLLAQIINSITGPLGEVLQMVGLEIENKNITIISILVKYFIVYLFINNYEIAMLIAISNIFYYSMVKLLPVIYLVRLK